MKKIKCPVHHREMKGEYIKTREVIAYRCPVKGCSVVITNPGKGENDVEDYKVVDG